MSTSPPTRGTILVLTQVYVPDPAAVGQYLHDAAVELVERGYRVVVYAAARGYDDPSQKFPLRELRDGVEIRRMPLSSFGKASIPLRILGGLLLMFQQIFRGLFARGVDRIIVSTSPPMCPIAALVISWLRFKPIIYWVMDVNPDQVIELGKVKDGSLPVRIMNWLNRRVLGRARRVVALDRFMLARLLKKRDVEAKTVVMPPWPHDDHMEMIDHVDNPWREQHVEGNKFVVMYSGNHGFSTPIKTVLDAALLMQDDDGLEFLFIGGGVGKQLVDDTIASEHPSNVRSLPYQPLETLRYSLSAADVHLVSVGDDVVGIVHPCKIYGAMAVGRPILLLAPDPCHASDLVRENNIGWHIPHGDVEGARRVLEEIRSTPPEVLREMGQRAQETIRGAYSKAILCGRFCDEVEEKS
ncbi:MAG: glycosyltransferase family 4 protein [Planctomycetes bacterium]|jgi:glycosyltransferase involved in cell wall biosynthesis|nr:glycosyltransferase family 4 protein [Planctomycetota bacterium]MCP4839694.1 glycosyltransferase family 4 protein [Planctomycetota bacterium]